MSKKKAMNSEKARFVRAKGYIDALEFARLIGVESDYKNNLQAKKDVVDPSGDTHSVKSGQKRWQIFLYSRSRFENDDAFLSMNGIGQTLIECIDVFPERFKDYTSNKEFYKEKLREPMRKLKDLLLLKRRLRTFLNKSLFNGGEVNYLTIKNENKFHVFYSSDVVRSLADNLIVENSQKRKQGDYPEQKVVFKYKNRNLGELEIRNSGENHYKEVLFIMNKKVVLELLFEHIPFKCLFNDSILLYGESSKHFGKWKQNSS